MIPCSRPIRRASSSSRMPASASPSDTRSWPRFDRARALLGRRTGGNGAGHGLLGDPLRLAVPAGAHEPAAQPDQHAGARRGRWLGRDQADRFEVLGMGLLVALGRPQAVPGARVEDPGQARILLHVDQGEGVAQPTDGLVVVADVVGHDRRPPPKLDGIRGSHRRRAPPAGRAARGRWPPRTAGRPRHRRRPPRPRWRRRWTHGRPRPGGRRRASGGPARRRRRPAVGRRARAARQDDGEPFVEGAPFGGQQCRLDDLAEQGVPRTEGGGPRFGHEGTAGDRLADSLADLGLGDRRRPGATRRSSMGRPAMAKMPSSRWVATGSRAIWAAIVSASVRGRVRSRRSRSTARSSSTKNGLPSDRRCRRSMIASSGTSPAMASTCRATSARVEAGQVQPARPRIALEGRQPGGDRVACREVVGPDGQQQEQAFAGRGSGRGT